VIDIKSDFFKRVAHGIIRDAGEVNNGVNAGEQPRGECPDIGKVLFINPAFGKDLSIGQTVRKIPHIKACKLRVRIRGPQPLNNARSDVSHVAGN
jgi:hypothetical protein